MELKHKPSILGIEQEDDEMFQSRWTAAFLLAANCLLAQSTGQIAGTVKDPSGAAIRGRSGSSSTVPPPSQTFVTIFIPAQAPENRDSAMASSP